jgi:hypothetical protein
VGPSPQVVHVSCGYCFKGEAGVCRRPAGSVVELVGTGMPARHPDRLTPASGTAVARDLFVLSRLGASSKLPDRLHRKNARKNAGKSSILLQIEGDSDPLWLFGGKFGHIGDYRDGLTCYVAR